MPLYFKLNPNVSARGHILPPAHPRAPGPVCRANKTSHLIGPPPPFFFFYPAGRLLGQFGAKLLWPAKIFLAGGIKIVASP